MTGCNGFNLLFCFFLDVLYVLFVLFFNIIGRSRKCCAPPVSKKETHLTLQYLLFDVMVR
jgi:hypothetical protein